MADIFQEGDEGSRSKFVAALQAIQNKGQAVLADLEQTRVATLLRFEHGLGALNSRRQRVLRLPSPDIAARFIVSDLLDVDQTVTSATLRPDSQAVTLRERGRPTTAVIQVQQFSASTGSTEVFGGIYRVTVSGNNAPTGVFDLKFESPLNLTLIVFDLVMSPSEPNIRVRISENGVQFTEALGISRNGYRVSAWLPEGSVKFLRIEITPSHPDTLGGNSYSFGLTSFNAFMVEFHLASELATFRVPAKPLSHILRFVADDTPGVLYFLALGDAPFVGVTPGQLIPVPGAVSVVGDGTAELDVTGRLGWKDALGALVSDLPMDLYIPTLVVNEGEVRSRMAPGLNPAAAAAITNQTLCWYNRGLYYRPFVSGDTAKRFTVSYTSGPASLLARLRVQLTTRDRSQTPVFKGAQLENT